MRRIKGRYTLFTHIPVVLDGARVLTDPLWAKDIVLHLDYITDFKLCCPVEPLHTLPQHYVAVPGLKAVDVVGLRRDFGYISVLRNILPNILAVAGALKNTQIAHSGGAGWAFPLAFYILPFSFLFQFQWIMVIESSFWMKPIDRKATVREEFRHVIYSILLGSCLKRAQARIFTTDFYRQFFGVSEEKSLINNAIWIDTHQIISAADLETRLLNLSSSTIRFLFPARLVPDKGCDTILNAIEILDRNLAGTDLDLHIDIIGEGPLRKKVHDFVNRREGQVSVRLLEAMEYGDLFFNLLQQYHAVLLANKQSEQPRIIFDAFSQGVPVISSATTGVLEISQDAINALHYPIGDAAVLADQIILFSRDAALRRNMALEGYRAVQGNSHARMHEVRRDFLTTLLDG